MENHRLRKRMMIMLIILACLFGLIFGYKMLGRMLFRHAIQGQQNPPMTVSTMKVGYQSWQSAMKAIGTLRAIQGIDVTTELAGMVRSIDFAPGSFVTKGQKLAQLNIDSDVAKLKSLEANAELASITLKRDQAQLRIHAVSQATVDTDIANLKSLEAQIAEQNANIEKKSIVAPFSGKLGISLINLGQFLNPGDKVVSLQSLDPIYVDFYIPQQFLAKLKVGLEVIVTTSSFPNHKFKGKVTTIDPRVNTDTRNVLVEATLQNPKNLLAPGMFVRVDIDEGSEQRLLTIPQAAVSFNPYGDVIFIVHQKETDDQGKPVYVVRQTFITTGEMRGDQIAVINGLKENDVIVTSGQLKLKNGSRIIINNAVQPSNNPAPLVLDDEI